MVPQEELTQVTCVASGAAMEFVVGRVLSGRRNGSPDAHDAFSSFLRCLLRADGSECVLLLHVDDVLFLVKETYLNETLVPALRAKYKILLDVVCKEGDELTFLKRKHVMVSPNQLAIQSLPKHLEKLFELLKIKRSLMPKKTPGHSFCWMSQTTPKCCDGVLLEYCLVMVYEIHPMVDGVAVVAVAVAVAAEEPLTHHLPLPQLYLFELSRLPALGAGAPKQLLRILLFALSPADMAMASLIPADDVSSGSSSDGFAWSFMNMKTALIALLVTLLCGALAPCFYLRYALGKAHGESFARRMDMTLHETLELEYRVGWNVESK
eukprot:s3258_g10.t1